VLKRLIFEAMWDSGERFNVGVDAMLLPTEIEVPEREERTIALLLGQGLPKPISDMEIGDEGFKCTLSFPGIGLRHVKIPWSGMYAIFVPGGIQAGWPRNGRPSEPPSNHLKVVK